MAFCSFISQQIETLALMTYSKIPCSSLNDAFSVNVHTKCNPCTGERIGSQFYQVVENTDIISAVVETFMLLKSLAAFVR